MTRYIIILIFAIAAGCAPSSKTHKVTGEQAGLETAITQRTFVFHAQTVQPASGRSRQLTSSYTFSVNKDSISSDLPYFGRAYSAPLDLTQSVLRFDSPKFDYKNSPGKKGGWNIDIKFNDVREVQTASLSISKDGYASLQVIPTNRQIISFIGTVDAK